MKLLNTFHISSNAILLLGAAEKRREFCSSPSAYTSSAFMLQVSDSPFATERECPYHFSIFTLAPSLVERQQVRYMDASLHSCF